MNKSELITAIAEHGGSTKTDIEKFLNSFQAVFTKCLKDGKKISLAGFFTAETVHRKATKGHNPRTREVITIEAKNVVKVRVGKTVTDALN